jgi:hypothetical protein
MLKTYASVIRNKEPTKNKAEWQSKSRVVAAAAAACCAAALAQAAMIAGLYPPSFPAADNVSARVTSVMLPSRCSCAAGYSGDVSPPCSVTYCLVYILGSIVARGGHQERLCSFVEINK